MNNEAFRALVNKQRNPTSVEKSTKEIARGQKALVILASVLGVCCLCGCVGALWQKRRSSGSS